MTCCAKFLLSLVSILASFGASADCDSSLPLDGSIALETCDTHANSCISAAEAAQEYWELFDDGPAILSISVQASPWRLYDADMRILSVEELAEMVKPKLTAQVEKIALLASWTGVAPSPGGESLAQKLSNVLDGFPVTGMDGFLWIARDGSLRTTHHAFTVRRSGFYRIPKGDDVFFLSSLVGRSVLSTSL